jgi:hypothetical protein
MLSKIVCNVKGLVTLNMNYICVVHMILVLNDIVWKCRPTVWNHLPIRWQLSYDKIRIIPNFVVWHNILSEFVPYGMNLCCTASWCCMFGTIPNLWLYDWTSNDQTSNDWTSNNQTSTFTTLNDWSLNDRTSTTTECRTSFITLVPTALC